MRGNELLKLLFSRSKMNMYEVMHTIWLYFYGIKVKIQTFFHYDKVLSGSLKCCHC